jgi:hypothetical protein
LGLEAGVAVARRLDPHGPQLGLHGLLRRAVAVIAGAPGRRLPGLVAQVLGELGAQRRLDHAAGELREQAARASDLLRLETFQRLLELLAQQQAGQAIRHLPGRTLSDGGRRGLSLSMDFVF